MGCSQSKVNADVIEPVSASPSKCGKTSMDLAFTEIILDDNEETSDSEPPTSVKEVDEREIKTDDHSQKDSIEQPAARSVVSEAPVEVELSVAVDDPVAVQMPVIAEDAVFREANEAKIVLMPVVEVEEEYLDKPEVEDEDNVQLAADSMIEKFAATSVGAPAWTFSAYNISFIIDVAFFNITGCNSEGDKVQLTKRYSEFKALHTDMAKLMSSEELPRMPGASFLQSRNNKTLLQERETIFVKMLNVIAQHPRASQSASFAAFLA